MNFYCMSGEYDSTCTLDTLQLQLAASLQHTDTVGGAETHVLALQLLLPAFRTSFAASEKVRTHYVYERPLYLACALAFLSPHRKLLIT